MTSMTEQTYLLIRDRGPLTVREVADTLEIPIGTANCLIYALARRDILARVGAVRRDTGGGVRDVGTWAATGKSPSLREGRGEVEDAIMRILAIGPATAKDISESSGMYIRSVQAALYRLNNAGRVRRTSCESKVIIWEAVE